MRYQSQFYSGTKLETSAGEIEGTVISGMDVTTGSAETYRDGRTLGALQTRIWELREEKEHSQMSSEKESKQTGSDDWRMQFKAL
ncbi:hypothetical protein Y1Q_0011307 [Alligator mississippiensis]|uniref:Uncharacterized protein n=1 Tax=Alligator mississippiensis TaxID=8496 RepID=A0A151N8A7_ALLMI|nr:hypothetical protein Y1Q_0011307 [Alligator mississippiensis]